MAEKTPKKQEEATGKPAAQEQKEAKPAPKADPKAKKEAKPAAASAEPTQKKNQRPGDSPRRGKKLRVARDAARKKLAAEFPATLNRAIELLKKHKRAKFDETVEIHMSLGIDSTQSDQMIRGTVSLPHGVGKEVRVLVFCQGDNVEKAKAAGADHAGSDDLIKKIQDGWTDFDVALATQDMMPKVSRLGKVLGPRGLMPTPKAGTVIMGGGDVGQLVQEFKAGKVEYRSDKTGNVHAGVGKLSFEDEQLVGNIMTFVNQIRAVKPTGIKGNYIHSITVTSTMGLGIPVAM